MRDKCFHSVPHVIKFKLSLACLLLSLVLALAGITGGFRDLTVGIPIPLLLSVLVALPSAALYFKVRDRFWEEVYKKCKLKDKSEKKPVKTIKDPLVIAVIVTSLIALTLMATMIPHETPAKTVVVPSYSQEDVFIDLKISDLAPKRLVLLNDGTLIYEEGGRTDVVRVSEEELASLRQFIVDKHFYLMKKEYQAGCNNCVAHTLTINLHGNVHSIYCYFGCPDEFYEITEKIKSTWPEKISYIGFD
ncbi:MAG: hypothetical protein ABH834_06670 [Candidatus Altiarchaeota archaeon]